MGDAGLTALAVAIRQLPALKVLVVDRCGIGDPGVAALMDGPVLKALEHLHLNYNSITDAGCAMLASARGVVPALLHLGVRGNPANERAQRAALRELQVESHIE